MDILFLINDLSILIKLSGKKSYAHYSNEVLMNGGRGQSDIEIPPVIL